MTNGGAPAQRALARLRAIPAYASTIDEARGRPRTWLVTGAAGFIGSHLASTLVQLGQNVVGFDDLSTGRDLNLDAVAAAGREAEGSFRFVRGDLRDAGAVRDALRNVDVVLHHAAYVSVPGSIRSPRLAHDVNVTGFLNVLEAMRETGARRLVYAASSASYGDDDAPVKSEERIGRPLSLYAATKTANEHYAAAYAAAYDLTTVGLRYFNVFGARQDPDGAYAAVVPRWIDELRRGAPCRIFGDGRTTRDFCHVTNVVGANLLASAAPDATPEVYNVGTGVSTSLVELFDEIRAAAARRWPDRADLAEARPVHEPFRPGDVRHSLADVSRARARLGYEPVVSLADGLDDVLAGVAAPVEPPS